MPLSPHHQKRLARDTNGEQARSTRRMDPAASTSYELPVLNLSRMTAEDEESTCHPTPSPSPPPPASSHLHNGIYPPPPHFSYAHQDQLIMRRQPSRPREGGGAKRYTGSPARFANMTTILDDLEFSGWGSQMQIDEQDLRPAQTDQQAVPAESSPKFGALKASGIAGNAVLGSV